jgi:hypothetical protein
MVVLATTGLLVVTLSSEPATPAQLRCSWRTFPIPVFRDAAHPAALGSVATASAGNAWASGFSTNALSGRRQTLMLHWNGASWRVVRTPDPTHNFAGWVAAAGGQAWAVGRGSRGALTMHWDSKKRRWVVVPNAAPSGSSLTDLTISSADDVWATGTAKSGRPFVIRWNGKSWSIVEHPDFGDGSYASVGGIPGTGEVWIWGNDGASYGLAAARWSSTAARWEKFALPVQGGGWTTTPRSIVADSASSAWIALTVDDSAGTNHPFTLFWDGKTWAPVSIPNPNGNASLTGIAAARAGDIWTVGNSLTKGPKGRTRQSFVLHWNGAAWSNVGSPRHSAVLRPGSPVGLGGIAATPGTGPVWVVGVTLDEYHC